MIPVITRSSDVGAPVLSGTVGALIGVLDYCLVTRLGWSKVFSGTNLASYRAPAGVRHYYDVNDTVATTSNFRGYETMTAVATGTGLFPTVAQVAAPGLSVTKSATADATARPWICFGDDRTAYLLWTSVATGFPQNWSRGLIFGEFLSVVASDNYRSIASSTYRMGVTGPGGSTGFAFAPRNYVGASAAATFLSAFQDGTLQGGGVAEGSPLGVLPFPNPADGGLYLAKVGITEHGTGSSFAASTIVSVRGMMRGLYQVCHPAASFAEGDTFDGSGLFAGRSFIITKISPSTAGVAAIETTQWDTNV